MPKRCSGVARWANKSSRNISAWLWRQPRMNWGESLNSGLLQQSRGFVCICHFGKSGSLEMCHMELFLGCSWLTFLCLRNVCFCKRPEEGQWVCVYLLMHILSFHDRLVSTWRSTANLGISWPELSASSPSTMISTMSWRSWQGGSPPFRTWGRESVWTGCNTHSEIFKMFQNPQNSKLSS